MEELLAGMRLYYLVVNMQGRVLCRDKSYADPFTEAIFDMRPADCASLIWVVQNSGLQCTYVFVVYKHLILTRGVYYRTNLVYLLVYSPLRIISY